MTGMVPIMWTVWGALVLLMLLLKIYNDRLPRDEDDQLVLDEAFDHVKNQQAAIMAKVSQLLYRLVVLHIFYTSEKVCYNLLIFQHQSRLLAHS